jgi:uncharacterized protein involved in response to NO
MSRLPPYSGPALFSYGFRPFFLAATLFGLGVIPVWLLIWNGQIDLAPPFSPIDWHIHEMLFGYASAVIAGFLFTAVPNWTGRMPTRGWPLMTLLGLWLLGRIAVSGALGIGPLAVMALDAAFLLAIGAMIVVEIVAGKNWRNLMVVVPVLLLVVANITFHVEAMTEGTTDIGRRLAISVVVFLITLIGGRIIPSFTRNWLAARGATALPVPFGGFDRLCLLGGAVALLCWTALRTGPLPAALLAAAAALHLARLARWQGVATWRSPLLLMLHVAYLFLPLGLAGAAAGAAGYAPEATGVHLLGIGGIGGMTFAVIIRATRGHTGRDLVAGPALTLAFGLLALAGLLRALLPEVELPGIDGITLAGLLWTVAYAILSAKLVPWVARPNAARRQPGKA